MNPIRCEYQLAAADSDGLAQAQSLGAAGNLALNGALVSGGVGTFDVARRLGITSAADDSGLTWTVTGTDRYSNPQTESFAGVDTATAESALDFLTVTAIHGSTATAGNVTAGTTTTGSTPWFPREFNSLGVLGVLIWVTSGNTVTAAFEITWDDVNIQISKPPYGISVEPTSDYPPKAVPVTGMDSVLATKYATVDVPHFFFRMTITSGTDPAILQVIETSEVNGGGY